MTSDTNDTDDAKLTAALERAGMTWEQAEEQAHVIVRECVAKYGDGATTILGFRAYKAMRRDPESIETIVLRLAQVILAEAT